MQVGAAQATSWLTRQREDAHDGSRQRLWEGRDVEERVMEAKQSCRWCAVRDRKKPRSLVRKRGLGWRWRESNPRPSAAIEGFSGRSHYAVVFGLPISRGLVGNTASVTVSFPDAPVTDALGDLPGDARPRGGRVPGLTDFLVLSLLRQRERSRCA